MGHILKWKALLLVVLSIQLYSYTASGNTFNNDTRIPINLLVMIPWPDPRPFSETGWDFGLEMLAGGRAAAKEVNERTNILSNYRFDLLVTATEPCEDTEDSGSISNLAYHIFNNNVSVVAGLYCSTSTSLLAPVAGISGVDLLQLAASNSPLFNEMGEKFPHHWRFLQSAGVYSQMMITLMDKYNWENVGLVQDLKSVFYVGMATSFINTIGNDLNKNITFRGGLVETNFAKSIVDEIEANGIRIVYFTATETQIGAIVCEAFSRGMKYPNYVWVVGDFTLEFIHSQNKNTCNVTEAMYGAITSFFDLVWEDDVVIESSNITYRQYVQKYDEALEEIVKEYQDLIIYTGDVVQRDVQYGGILYDQVWAFALAVEKALPELEANNLSIADYGYNQPKVTKILEKSLSSLNFRGATGYVSFSEYREVGSRIAVYQNIYGDSTKDLVGRCETIKGSFTCENVTLFLDNFDDEIDSIIVMFPVPLGVVTILIVCFIIALTSFILFLLLWYRKEPEVKATSPFLSLMMFVGCYFLCFAALLHAILVIFQISKLSFSALCNIEIILAVNGCNLIFVTLFIKLFRISKIFNNKRLGSLGKVYSNYSLFVIVLVFCCLPDVILIVMVSYDPMVRHSFVQLRSGNGFLMNDIQYFCYSSKSPYLWLFSVIGYLMVFIALIVYLAISTRKIQNGDFKDTKKVNIFIFLALLSFTIPIPLGVLLLRENESTESNDNYYFGNVMLLLGYLALASVTQIFLFMPKVLPILLGFRKRHRWSRSTVSQLLKKHSSFLF